MRKLVLCIAMMLALGVNNSSTYAQTTGKVFKAKGSVSHKGDTIVTTHLYETRDGKKYPIIIRKNTGRCYVWKTSGKTGKLYRYYIEEEFSREIAKSMGVTYTEPKAKAKISK